MHIEDAHPDIVAAAEAGPHGGWSTWDAKLEGARFHLIQEAVAADQFDLATADRLLGELVELAQSYGYGVADSYHSSADGLSDDEVASNPGLAFMFEGLYVEDGHEDPYFVEVRASERLLADGAVTEEARAFLGAGSDGRSGAVFDRMHAAFIRGRDLRAAQTFPKVAP